MISTANIFSYLDNRHINYELYHHKAVASATDIANMPLMNGTVVKNLILTTKDKKLFMYTLPLHTRADLKALAEELDCSRLSFGSSSDLAFLGIPAGMVSPLCLLNDRQGEFCYVQAACLDESEIVNCHPFSNSMSIDIKRCDLEAIVKDSGHEIIKSNAIR